VSDGGLQDFLISDFLISDFLISDFPISEFAGRAEFCDQTIWAERLCLLQRPFHGLGAASKWEAQICSLRSQGWGFVQVSVMQSRESTDHFSWVCDLSVSFSL
jgi:hypothetical protein